MASITLFISWVSINKNLAIADKQYLLLCGLNSSVTRRLARKCSCLQQLCSKWWLVAAEALAHYNQVVWLMCCTMWSDEPFFEAVFWLYVMIFVFWKLLMSWEVWQHFCMHNIFSKSFDNLRSEGCLFFLLYCACNVIYAYFRITVQLNFIKLWKQLELITIGTLMWNLFHCVIIWMVMIFVLQLSTTTLLSV